DESSYSRWEHLSLVDLATGGVVSPESELPTEFRLRADLRRPEARATVWLVGSSPDRREGLELDRDRRNARWMIQRGGGIDALPRWFFPEQPASFAAELVQQVGRAAAAAYALALASFALGWAIARLRFRVNLSYAPFVRDAVLAAWLVAAALVATRVFHQ